MNRLVRLTLLSDGPTDQALMPILRWLLKQHATRMLEQNWADLRRLKTRPSKLAGRVAAALDLYPCNLLVVHRDAEREPAANRVDEIAGATRGLQVPIVCAVPVRMTEAWLLFDEAAIRRAAGCPNGTVPLRLPPLKSVESLPDPKDALRTLLVLASNLSGRRLKRFQPDIRRLADLTDDFSPLRELSSFRAMEDSLRAALRRLDVLRA